MKTSEIATLLNGRLDGNPDLQIRSVSDLKSLGNNTLGFVAGKTDDPSLLPPDSCILIPEDDSSSYSCTTIRVKDPKIAFARITPQLVKPARRTGRHPSYSEGEGSDVRATYIGPGVSVGRNCTIAEGVVLHAGAAIGDNVVIGEASVIERNVSVYENTRLGKGCVLHSGAVIGASGFGYVRDGDEIVAFPQLGGVRIGDRVEIGANTCVDRAALGDTVIGDDTKIDNLVQVAHNVQIGERVLIAALVGISGSVVIEDDVVIGGQVGIGDHVTIRSGAVVGAGSGIFPGKILRAGFWAGKPVQPIKDYKKQIVLNRSVGRLKEEIENIKKMLDSITARPDKDGRV